MLSQAQWLPPCKRIGRAITPVKFLALLRAWTASGLGKTQSPYVLARQVGMSYKPVARIVQSLLKLEVEAGRCRNDSLRLSGYVECDATSLRCIRVPKKSQTYQVQVQDHSFFPTFHALELHIWAIILLSLWGFFFFAAVDIILELS